jgi:Bacterial conjugation TrbI-like protein
MTEESEARAQSGLNWIGWALVGTAAAALVVIVIYTVLHEGIKFVTNGEGSAADNNAIDLAKLRAEAQFTPTPAPRLERSLVSLIEPQVKPIPSPTPTPQRVPDPMEEWRRQEALKAREASPIVAAFEPKPNQTKEIPSLASLSKLHPPASPWTITEGSIISAILQFGVNSDYPGDIVSQTERPLYDSAIGRYLLIPAGSKLIGKFERPIGPFQERVPIIWHRLVLPNQWSMDLPDVPSMDTRGYAAVPGDVNHHYLSTLGTATLVSLFSIGGEVASALTFSNTVSPYGGGVYAYNPTQQVGNLAVTNAASQLGATGNRFLEPRLNRPNTITIPAGSRFDVFVNSDLILPGPYSDTAGQLISTVTQR